MAEQTAASRVATLTQQQVHSSPVASSTSSSSGGSFDCTADKYAWVEVEKVGRVAVIRLNRPKAFNALSDALVGDLCLAIKNSNRDEGVGCIVVTGNGKAFAAGADIKEMAGKTYYEMSTHDKIEPWDAITQSKLPLIAAVNGVAFGGGCEIAMMCDIIFAAESAKFGQPEIKIGTIPGAGGTQRLTRAVGKSKAMEWVLTGRPFSAKEAEAAGLISAVLPDDKLLPHAMAVAQSIAGLSKPIVKLAKEAVSSAFETTLHAGARVERRLFHSTFALKDQGEGMRAFAEKRPPAWAHL